VNSQAAVPQALLAKARRLMPRRRCFSSTSDRQKRSRRRASAVGGGGQNSPLEGGSKSIGGNTGRSGSDFFMVISVAAPS
jgi:hypothetical protein